MWGAWMNSAVHANFEHDFPVCERCGDLMPKDHPWQECDKCITEVFPEK
tara:strand:- start:389 stop:535 length:147 start_codon:yes stop_codon:yes gene_type:complete